jgi:hypothetical protein
MKTILLVAFVIVLFVLGIACLFYPSKIQEIAVKSVNYGILTENSPIKAFVQSSNYLIVVRAVGIIATLCFCFLTWVLFRNVL